MKTLEIIAVYPGSFFDSHRRLWSALEALSGVCFRAWRDGDEAEAGVVWMEDPSVALVEAVAGRGGRCLVWPSAGGVACTRGGVAIHFGTDPTLDECLRGEVIAGHRALELGEMPGGQEGRVMAAAEGRPLWVRISRDGGGVVDHVAVRPPELAAGRMLRQHLKPWHCASLLPVLHVLREVVGPGGWEPPPRRACFIFDDPSLYWPSYGCLRFAELAKHAAEHGYHASIATVPFDAWWGHDRVIELLRRQEARVSLVMHGNDHTHHEMWESRPAGEWTAVLAQALRRVQAFERRHGLAFARVMEAPHALLSGEAFGPMARLGFEGSLYTPALAKVFSREFQWPVTLGSVAMDRPPEGVAALPRMALSANWRVDLMLSEFLRQPLILAGHHQDVAEGLGFLEDFAARVNRWGGVQWGDPGRLARSTYESLREGGCWRVRMGGRVVECTVPAGVSEVRIERPWSVAEDGPLRVSGLNGGVMTPEFSGEVAVVPVRADHAGPVRLRLESPLARPVDPMRVAAPRRRVWPLVRKLLVEARDRSFPYRPASLRRRKPAFTRP